MAQWYVKELSQLTHVSAQTLHHYDRIHLLKPSIRLPNGYRLYSEKDLLKLQQILALKYFGFELSQIKKLLADNVDVIAHFSAQLESLKNKIDFLTKASKTLEKIISDYSHSKSIHWETIIQLIEVYRMTQQPENAWASKVLNPDELKEYAQFKSRLSEKNVEEFKQGWNSILLEVNKSLKKDPISEYGVDIGRRAMELVNHYYGKKYVHVRNTVWEKGLKSGAVSMDESISPECIPWLDKAIAEYYKQRILKILTRVNKQSNPALLTQWNELMSDMCGDDKSKKKDLYEIIMKHEEVSQIAKDWVKKNS